MKHVRTRGFPEPLKQKTIAGKHPNSMIFFWSLLTPTLNSLQSRCRSFVAVALDNWADPRKSTNDSESHASGYQPLHRPALGQQLRRIEEFQFLPPFPHIPSKTLSQN
jgi:hypothetical protein